MLARCVVCDARLPLRMPRPGEVPVSWNCTGCGTRYLALLAENAPAEWLENVCRQDAAVPGTQDATKAEPVESSPPDDGQAAPEPAAAANSTEQTPTGGSPSAGIARYTPSGSGKIALPARAGVICTWENAFTRTLDREIDNASQLRVRASNKPFSQVMRKPVAAGFSEQTIERFVQSFEQSTTQIDGFFEGLRSGHATDLRDIEAVAQNGLIGAAEDLDLFVTMGINVPPGAYPGRHSLHVAMVAMSIGATWGCDVRALMELGIGCLIHDLGMLKVERVNYQEGRVFAAADFREIARHPIYTLELLKPHLEHLPLASRIVAFQTHERLNGSGYPRGRTAGQIHDLAKIAAVADVFVALTSNRPHRPGLMPYYALERMIHGVKDGLYDGSIVRALLKTVSLFPVGSYVALSDGRKGKVLRTNAEHYAKPIVAILDGNETSSQVIVDLAEETSLTIRSALPGPPAGEQG